MECQAKFAPPASKTMSLKPGSKALNKNQFGHRGTILNYLMPDFSKIKPKLNIYLRIRKTEGEDEMVSCTDVSEKDAYYRLEFLISFVHDGFVLVPHLYFLNCWIILT
jgi:hypothetical protein